MDEQRDVQGQEVKTDATERFEQELTQAMRRVDAPRSLAVFLQNAAELEAAQSQQRAKKPLWFRRGANSSSSANRILMLPRMQSWMGGALAAVLVLGCFGAITGIHVRNEHRQAEAEKQFAESQEITDRALEHVREQMEKAGVSLDGKQ
jgi:hypothetical protein